MPPVGFEPTISAGERPQAAHLLRSWVRIPPGAWIFVCCECRVLSGRGLCDELITRPGESYRLCCVFVCNLETSRIGAPYIYIYIYIYIYNISRLRLNVRGSRSQVSWTDRQQFISTLERALTFAVESTVFSRLFRASDCSGISQHGLYVPNVKKKLSSYRAVNTHSFHYGY